MPADRIRQHRALTDEKLPTAMQHQARLLLFRFCWHEPHRRSRYRLTDRSSIIRVILAALEVSLHIVRWHQPHRMAERLKLAAPMMCGRTRLNTNKAWRQGSEKLRHLSAAYPPADHHCAINIHAVDLKDRLRNIETNCANFAHGRLPSSWFASTQPPYGTLMPQSGRRPQHHSQHWPVSRMSASPPIVTVVGALQKRRFVPVAEVGDSFDHLVRDGERRSSDRDNPFGSGYPRLCF